MWRLCLRRALWMMMNMKDGWQYAAGAMTLSVDLHAAIAAASCLREPEKSRWTVLCRAEAGGTELWDRGQVHVPELGHVPDPCPKINERKSMIMEINEKNGNIYVSGIEDFHLAQTLECGQCFHFEKVGENDYFLSAKGRFLHICQQEDCSVIFYDGSLSTGHANSTQDMLSRLETMVLQGAAGLPLEAIRQQIGSAIDIIIHLSRLRDKSRKTMEITEVLGVRDDGHIELNPLYVFEENPEKSSLDKVVGSLKRTANPMKNDFKLRLAGIREEI